MAEGESAAAWLPLLTWLSPAFPVGGFAYSHGLEQAIAEGVLADRAGLVAWLEDLLRQGSAWNDAVLFAEAWRRAFDPAGSAELEDLARALAGSKERLLETTQQGGSCEAALATWRAARGDDPAAAAAGEAEAPDAPYPIALGRAARREGIALPHGLAAYLHAFASNLVQGAVRLVPLGQRDGVAALAALGPAILETAEAASSSGPEDLGSACVRSEIMSLRHETLYSRVFRS